MISVMAACPWCKAAVGDLLAPCPSCGRRADDQADMLAGAAVPDLDIPARTSKAAPPKAAAKPAPQAPPPRPPPARTQASSAERGNNAFNDPGARTIDADDDGGLGDEKIDLDLKGPPLIDTLAKAAAPAPAPKKEPPAKKPGEVDPYEARALADYGEAPAQWWKTPLYAYRVLRRRPELKKIAEQKRREAERARGAADDALVAFAGVVRSRAERLGAYAGAFESVRATEQVLGERDAVLATETAAHKQRQAEHDAKLAELEAQLSQIQIEERTVGGELTEAEALLRRAEARAKRVEIEIRTAMAEQAGANPADAAKGPGA
jgi:hypothetical protein